MGSSRAPTRRIHTAQRVQSDHVAGRVTKGPRVPPPSAPQPSELREASEPVGPLPGEGQPPRFAHGSETGKRDRKPTPRWLSVSDFPLVKPGSPHPHVCGFSQSQFGSVQMSTTQPQILCKTCCKHFAFMYVVNGFNEVIHPSSLTPCSNMGGFTTDNAEQRGLAERLWTPTARSQDIQVSQTFPRWPRAHRAAQWRFPSKGKAHRHRSLHPPRAPGKSEKETSTHWVFTFPNRES